MKRYKLPPPPAGKMTDIAAWTECVENSMAQFEHQATRICNLELMVVQWGLGLRTPLFTNNSVYEQIFLSKTPRVTNGVSDYEHNLATAAN
jgi:hypothetical protein